MPDNFWVPRHRFNSATGEQKGITQTIYTDTEPPSRMPNSLIQAPSWEVQKAVRDRTPASRTWVDALTIMLWGGGRSWLGVGSFCLYDG